MEWKFVYGVGSMGVISMREQFQCVYASVFSCKKQFSTGVQYRSVFVCEYSLRFSSDLGV